MKLKFITYLACIVLLSSSVFAEEDVYIPELKTDMTLKKHVFKFEQNNQGYLFDTNHNPQYYDSIIYNGYFVDRTYNLINNNNQWFYMPMLRTKSGRR